MQDIYVRYLCTSGPLACKQQLIVKLSYDLNQIAGLCSIKWNMQVWG